MISRKNFSGLLKSILSKAPPDILLLFTNEIQFVYPKSIDYLWLASGEPLAGVRGKIDARYTLFTFCLKLGIKETRQVKLPFVSWLMFLA